MMTELAMARARERFQHTGISSVRQLRPEVLASWVRCQEWYRVDPMRKLGEVRPVPDGGLPLRQSAEPALRALTPTIAASEHLLILSDDRGQLLWIDGYEPLLRMVEERNIVAGAVFDEATAGTNGVGTVLEQGCSFEVIQAEHFCEGWQDLTCTGAIIRHPVGGNIAGVIDVTGHRTFPNSHTLPLVEVMARLIEREWSAQLLQRAWFIADVYAAYATRFPRQPVLAFDADGYLVQANAAGSCLLHLDPQSFLRHHRPLVVSAPLANAVVAELQHVTSAEAHAREIHPLVPSAPYPLTAALVPVVRDGQVLGAIAIVVDQHPAVPAPSTVAPETARRPWRRSAARLVGSGADGQLIVVEPGNVCYVHADNRGVWLHTPQGELRSTYSTLSALADALPPDLFFRANRAELANMRWVREIENHFPQSYNLVLSDRLRTRIPVSRRRLTRLRELLHF